MNVLLPSRVKTLLQFSTALTIVFLVISVFLYPFVLPHVFQKHRLSIGLAQVELSGGLTAGLERDCLREPKLVACDDLAVIVGLSTAREAFDTERLHSKTDHKWVLYGGSGGDIEGLVEFLQPLLSGSIQPAVLVFAIHPSHLVDDRKPFQDVDSRIVRNSWQDLLRLNLRKMKQNFKNYNKRCKNEVTCTLHRGKLWLATRCNMGADSLYDPINPWATHPKTYTSKKASQDWMDEQLKRWEERGWFDLTSYHRESRQSRQFVDLIHEFASSKSRIVIVLMPESETFRERLPSQDAHRAFLRAVSATRCRDDLTVLDLRNELEEHHFYDHLHVNPEGRKTFTKVFFDHFNGLDP